MKPKFFPISIFFLLIALFSGTLQGDAFSILPSQSIQEEASESFSIFVPGRLCLFGEHSDWAGTYRSQNSSLENGMAIITGTTQGIYAKVKRNPDNFIFSATRNNALRKEYISIPMDTETLLKEAEKGSFFSNVAGVAYQMRKKYRVGGIEIDNEVTDLPIKKGLSSSAAVCVLVARAFNQAYHLNLSLREEMEMAYLGEITTPSRCGRMDQGCAFGQIPILMQFDKEEMQVSPLSVGKELFLVVVDLGGKKDTIEILRSLREGFPFPTNDKERNVHMFLGPINKLIIAQAIQGLQEGDPQKLGELMKKTQVLFDRYLLPACPSQLTAPLLHKVLNYDPIQPYIWGGKGVGSGGDGSAQLIALDAEAQRQVIQILEDDLHLRCLPLTIHATN